MSVTCGPTAFLLHVSLLYLVAILVTYASSSKRQEREPDDSLFLRRSSSAVVTTPLQKELASATVSSLLTSSQQYRRRYPERNPHVCLAFLSCCNRIDLLNYTLAAAIRHLEDDEPSGLRYEIAWVDNGSSARNSESVQYILNTYPIEHALPLPQNMGLAMGMNLLMFQLCTAPYILLLEEDWLYLDDIVVEQTRQRKHAIARSIALLEQGNMVAYDGRKVIGVFLRPETYSSFLNFPYADVWNTAGVNMQQFMGPPSSIRKNTQKDDDESCKAENGTLSSTPSELEKVDYRIFCADTGLKSGAIWGSYTNGAGLYRRSDLYRIGRMYGEPGDAFHDSYVEGNYAFRAGLQACHAAIRLNDDPTCVDVGRNCTAAFYHIGGGRGTRPRKQLAPRCVHFAWNFYDTPLYEKFSKYSAEIGQPVPTCTVEELEELRQVRFKQSQTEEWQTHVEEESKAIFEKERFKRKEIRDQANAILGMNKDDVRRQVPWMSAMTDAEIDAEARRLIRFADSPHPMDGFWDSHGRPAKEAK